MLFSRKHKPAVFVGPSLSNPQNDSLFEIRPPIQAGDLNALKGSGQPVLIIDGLFGSTMSITVVECLEFLQAGGILLGCSSMGALRAADCYNNGMVGIGQIFQGYLLGYYRSDTDVAVRYHAGSYDEITLSYVHIDRLICFLTQSGQLSRVGARKILSQVRAISWYDRYIDRIVDIVCSHSPGIEGNQLINLFKDEALHPKKEDAKLAIHYLTQFYLARCES